MKTLSYRYIMRAAPFEDGAAPTPREAFRKHLQDLLASNLAVAGKLSAAGADNAQISAAMDTIRSGTLDQRKAFYIEDRINQQRHWYVGKAKTNRASIKRWVAIGVTAYLIGGILALSRIQFPQWTLWPIDPVIVFASSVIGWVQIKKFGELAAAYTVTAHEIGLLQPTIETAATEVEFSTAVNDAELAFSREHTSWIARQTN